MPSEARRTDGRVRRGADNRRKIVAAFIAFIREGELSPTAEDIAARADVGLRTVFRHFEDMERLYGEIAVVIEAEVRPIADRPFLAKTWRGRLDELLVRRAELFERIMPFRIAADVHRHASPQIAERQREFVALQRGYLLKALPASIARHPARLEALDLATSYEAWRRLRHEQQLPPAEAAKTMALLVQALIAGESP
jgi:AcrR family transcriptional regulator